MIPVFQPLLELEEKEAAQEALDLGWLGMGAYVGQFEEKLKQLIEANDHHIIAVSTGHAALHLGLLLMDVGSGDEVITPAFNNVADFQAIIATGAQPVFCDILDDTLCIDINKARELISSRTKAMIVMDYDCLLCDHDQVKDLSTEYGIRVLHDAAHSLGSRYKGQMVGSFSDVTMFSFDPVKTITCIDGGALVVKSEVEKKQLHEMRLIGMGQPSTVMYQNQRAWTYDVNRLGFRYHLSNLHAAIGLAQLSKFQEISSSRRELARFYNEKLSEIDEVVVPKTNFEDITPFLYYIRVPSTKRESLRDFLKEKGVDTGIHWQPGHGFKLFKDCRKGDLSVTNQVCSEILSLPFHSKMSLETRERVVYAIKEFFTKVYYAQA